MSLTKIPFILIATWAFKASITSPNSPAPNDEWTASRMPWENTSVYWGPFAARVSHYVIQ